MNRNDRYPRRCGTMNSPLGCSSGACRASSVESRADNCLCDSQPISLAMAYVPKQQLGELYSPCEGLKNGTMFPCLNKPYCAGGRRR